jgi:hypothetical protein
LSMMYSDLYTCSANGIVQVNLHNMAFIALGMTFQLSVGMPPLLVQRLGLHTATGSSCPRLSLVVAQMIFASSHVVTMII